jgi:hypothetical protein
MTDHRIVDELNRVANRQSFDPVDAAEAVRRGGRARSRRRGRQLAVSAVGGVTVAGVVLATQLGPGSSRSPSAAFEDPGGRVSLVAAGGPRDGYPDLVVSSRGGTVIGFGWPIEGMAPVSDRDGTVTFPEISKVDAETMCLPMLNQGAPAVPDAAWRHSGSWIDDFPSRAGLVATYEAEHGGRSYYASCTLPGDYSPARRPDLAAVPFVSADDEVLRQCSYQGHVDFRSWQVGAADRAGDTLSAALVSPEGYVARCVLSSDERQRVTQLSAVRLDEAPSDAPFLYGGDGTRTLTVAGVVGDEVETVEVATEGRTREVAVRGGVFAVVVPVDGRVPADDTVVRGLDAEGAEVAVGRVIADNPPDDMLVPAVCFTSVETGDDGC